MYILLIMQLTLLQPAPLTNLTNLGYFMDEGACETVAAGLRGLKNPSIVGVVCVPMKTPENKRL